MSHYETSTEAVLFCVVVLSVFGATLWNLTRTVPGQNALAAAGVAGGIAGIAAMIGVATGVPFGRYFYTEKCGPLLFNNLAWHVPFLWVTIIFNARGMARLMLRPWRKISTYGFRVIGLACALTVAFDFGLEAYAGDATRLWIWMSSGRAATWYGVPWVNFFSQAVVTLLILAFATPWLIKKRPGTPSRPDYFPLMMWTGLNTLLIAGNAAHHAWLAAGAGMALMISTGVVAWKNSH
jgi:putative membrane protein